MEKLTALMLVEEKGLEKVHALDCWLVEKSEWLKVV